MSTFAAAMARRESRVVRVVRRALITLAGIYMLFAAWSFFRRIRQILRMELRTNSLVLAPGSTVGYDVITSGETQNLIRLELVQGARRAVLIEQRARVNSISALDPRVFRYTPTVAMTPALLARFHSGPATLRVTGYGGQKLLHTPAPRIREIQVVLQP